jgi:hypothetical protein
VLFALLAFMFVALALCRVLRPVERAALTDAEVAAQLIADGHGHPELRPRFIDRPGTAVQAGAFLLAGGFIGYLALRRRPS